MADLTNKRGFVRRFLSFCVWAFLLGLFAFTFMFMFGNFLARRDAKPGVDLTCNVVHETKNGCPAGYRRVEHPVFTEKDGTKQNACFSPDSHKEDCTDFINPGESFEVTVPVVIEKPSVKGPRT